MNVYRLEIFVDLVKTLNYTDTADNFFTTQSNISKQILNLEKELEVKLFIRAHRKIKLTPAGKIVLKYAQKILLDSNSMKQELDDIKNRTESTIRILTIPTMPNYQSFTIITKFINSHPDIQLLLKEAESNSLFTALNDKKCDIIFARTFNSDSDKFEELFMENDNFVAVLPKNHKYADKNEIGLSDLSSERFLLLGPSTNLYNPVISLANQAGFEPQVTYKGSRIDLIIQMVEKGVGVSILTKKTVATFKNKDVSVVPLKQSLGSKLSFFRRKEQQSNAIDCFWEYIKENYSITE